MTQLVAERKRFPLGRRIRTARITAGMTTTKLAVALDVDPRTVARWQADQNRPSYEKLVEVARILGQPLGYFVEDEA